MIALTSAGGSTSAPRHHPSIETLSGYAAGNMRAGFDLVVAAHLQGCTACQAQVGKLERLGGHLLAEIDPVAIGEGALAATLARLDEPVLPVSGTAPGTLREKLDGSKLRWVAPGVWTGKIDTPHAPQDRVFLLRVAPGAATARHTHEGAEFTQVLEGALDDGGIIYRAGDFVELDQEHTHRPVVHGNEECLCLFATEGRLVPTDLIGRIAFSIATV
jgi:putative transcriptional regulator